MEPVIINYHNSHAELKYQEIYQVRYDQLPGLSVLIQAQDKVIGEIAEQRINYQQNNNLEMKITGSYIRNRGKFNEQKLYPGRECKIKR